MNIKTIKIVQIIFFLIFAVSSSFSQEPVPAFLSNTDWLESKDLKNWESTIGQLEDAETDLINSNELYLKMSSIESDPDIDEKKREKEITKLEKQAVISYNKALEAYKTIYSDLYAILEEYIGESQKDHPAYDEMAYANDQALSLYSQNSQGQTEDEREQFSKANEYKLLAVEKGITTLTTSSNTYTAQTTDNNAQSISAQEIEINRDLYNMYKDYMDDESVSDPITVESLRNMNDNNATFDEYVNKWTNYVNGQPVQSQTAQPDTLIAADSIQVTDPLLAENATNQNTNQTTTTNTANASNTSASSSSEQANANTNTNTNTNSQSTGSGKTSSQKLASELFAAPSVDMGNLNDFRVQVAASKSPLSMAQVQALYKGKGTIIEVKEGSYFKYQIRGFRIPTDAQKVCSQTGVDNAYIEAYQQGQRQNLSEAVKESRILVDKVNKVGRQRAFYQIDFAVQIAASRVKMSNAKINNIYNGSEPITLVFEGGWYKYQIIVGSDLNKAMSILDNCGVNKAFLTAYKNGQKLELTKALHEYKTFKP